eukprot:9114756-Pyramimonas_sp.AAC.1
MSAGMQKNRLAAAGALERMTKSELMAAAGQLKIVVKESISKEELLGLVRKVVCVCVCVCVMNDS